MFVLDSDTFTHLLQRHRKVVERMNDVVSQGETTGLTIVSKIEILQGRMSALLKADSHRRFLDAQQKFVESENDLETMQIVLLDESSLVIFDSLLEIRGLKKLGRADLLIASIVRSLNATLVTRNQKHFKLIPQLKIANWVD